MLYTQGDTEKNTQHQSLWIIKDATILLLITTKHWTILKKSLSTRCSSKFWPSLTDCRHTGQCRLHVHKAGRAMWWTETSVCRKNMRKMAATISTGRPLVRLTLVSYSWIWHVGRELSVEHVTHKYGNVDRRCHQMTDKFVLQQSFIFWSIFRLFLQAEAHTHTHTYVHANATNFST